jgi:hypothetical protein
VPALYFSKQEEGRRKKEEEQGLGGGPQAASPRVGIDVKDGRIADQGPREPAGITL